MHQLSGVVLPQKRALDVATSRHSLEGEMYPVNLEIVFVRSIVCPLLRAHQMRFWKLAFQAGSWMRSKSGHSWHRPLRSLVRTASAPDQRNCCSRAAFAYRVDIDRSQRAWRGQDLQQPIDRILAALLAIPFAIWCQGAVGLQELVQLAK